MHLDQKIPLKTFHTFGTEATARYFVEPKSPEEILTLLRYRSMIRMPILVLGHGSNLLFTSDFDGIIVKISSKGITARDLDDRHILVTAQSGETWDDLVRYCVAEGWAGLENLSLIPGTVGAAPVQNIGAYGVEAGNLVETVHFVHLDTGEEHWLGREDCRFGYRDSIFKNELKGKTIIMDVAFRLEKSGTAHPGDGDSGGKGRETSQFPGLKLDYGDIRQELQAMFVAEPDIATVREAICSIRRRKLPDPAVIGNAGSFFRNPVISGEYFLTLKKKFPEIPHFGIPDAGLIAPDGLTKQTPSGISASDTQVKIPAAWMIEHCGWRGFRNGDAGVHPGHALVLVNYGNATGREILALAEEIINSVNAVFGILLEPEVGIIGK